MGRGWEGVGRGGPSATGVQGSVRHVLGFESGAPARRWHPFGLLTVRLLQVPLGQRRQGLRVPGLDVGRHRPLVCDQKRGIFHRHACF